VIQSFKDNNTAQLFREGKSRRWSSIASVAGRKLDMIHAAAALNDLRVPPGNRLEALGGDRKGQHSIRINDQYRICFVWREDGVHEVETTDYHESVKERRHASS
jgi:toxin HigB-1